MTCSDTNKYICCPLPLLWTGVYMKLQKLSEESCCQLFRPSAVSSHTASGNGQDEIRIPDAELQRMHTLGMKHTERYTADTAFVCFVLDEFSK